MFTYIIEKENDNGCIRISEGERLHKRDSMLYFTEESLLLEALKVYKKSAVWIIDDTPELMKKGEELSKKLHLDFMHP